MMVEIGLEACCSRSVINNITNYIHTPVSSGLLSFEELVSLSTCPPSGTETEGGGGEVTNTGSTPATPKEPSSSSPTCKASEDCMEDEHYCSSNTGICLPYANCIDDSDCQNPDNLYSVPEFGCEDPPVEYMACNDGKCKKICIDQPASETTTEATATTIDDEQQPVPVEGEGEVEGVGSSAASLYTVTASLAMAFASLLILL